MIKERGEWCMVPFSEKPERSVLDELRAAGYRWGDGSWCGSLDKLPASIRDIARTIDEDQP